MLIPGLISPVIWRRKVKRFIKPWLEQIEMSNVMLRRKFINYQCPNTLSSVCVYEISNSKSLGKTQLTLFSGLYSPLGLTYHIPLCLWLMDTHPDHAPICYVKPTADMKINVSPNVDHTGKIYSPYLHTWGPVSICYCN